MRCRGRGEALPNYANYTPPRSSPPRRLQRGEQGPRRLSCGGEAGRDPPNPGSRKGMGLTADPGGARPRVGDKLGRRGAEAPGSSSRRAARPAAWEESRRQQQTTRPGRRRRGFGSAPSALPRAPRPPPRSPLASPGSPSLRPLPWDSGPRPPPPAPRPPHPLRGRGAQPPPGLAPSSQRHPRPGARGAPSADRGGRVPPHLSRRVQAAHGGDAAAAAPPGAGPRLGQPLPQPAADAHLHGQAHVGPQAAARAGLAAAGAGGGRLGAGRRRGPPAAGQARAAEAVLAGQQHGVLEGAPAQRTRRQLRQALHQPGARRGRLHGKPVCAPSPPPSPPPLPSPGMASRPGLQPRLHGRLYREGGGRGR